MTAGIKRTIEDVKEELSIINPKIIILSNTYVNNMEHLWCKCLVCNHEWGVSWSNLKGKKGCRNCRDMALGKSRLLTIEYVKEELGRISPHMKILDDVYIKNTVKLNYLCMTHNIQDSMVWGNLQQGQGCSKCSIEARSGENHHNYNPNLTDKDRMYNRDTGAHIKWRESVYSRDDYTCNICNKRGLELNAHHLNGYHWDIENRFNLDNGVTLCNDCHKDFHYVYGSINNTKEQYTEFKQSFTP